jgi:hypothetical protein
MKKSRIFRWSGYGLLAVMLLGVSVFLFLNKTSSSRIVLADEAKEHSIMLHNAMGDHACNCFQPWISNVTISNITCNSIDVSWKTGVESGFSGDGASAYQVTYGTTTSKTSIYPTTLPTVAYSQYTVTVPNLNPGTLYHLGVKGCCLANCQRGGGPTYCKTFEQSSGATDWTATTLAACSGHTISGIVGTTPSGKLAASAKTATPISGVLVTLSGGKSATVTTAADGKYSFTGLALGTYTVTPTKAGTTFTPPSRTFAALNADSTGKNFAIATGVQNPVAERAVMSEVEAAKITAQDVTVTWKTNIPATSMVEYGLTTAYGMKSGVNAEVVYNHYIQLFELQKGATYHARAVSYAEGNSDAVSYSADFTFKVPSFEDRIADKGRIFNEPNPAARWTMFSYYLFQPAKSVTIDIFSLSGKLMTTLQSPSSSLAEGWNKVRWDNINLPNGLYAFRMKFQTPANMEEQYKFSSLRIER